MINVRFKLDDYTIRVLDVVKGKFGLKNREEALKKLALEHGKEYVLPKPSEAFLKEMDSAYEEHIKKHGNTKMTDKQLRKLLQIEDNEKI